jgi:hypothetical protein
LLPSVSIVTNPRAAVGTVSVDSAPRVALAGPRGRFTPVRGFFQQVNNRTEALRSTAQTEVRAGNVIDSDHRPSSPKTSPRGSSFSPSNRPAPCPRLISPTRLPKPCELLQDLTRVVRSAASRFLRPRSLPWPVVWSLEMPSPAPAPQKTPVTRSTPMIANTTAATRRVRVGSSNLPARLPMNSLHTTSVYPQHIAPAAAVAEATAKTVHLAVQP